MDPSVYGVSQLTTELWLLWGSVFFVLGAVPFSYWLDKPGGLRATVVFSVALVVAGCVIRCAVRDASALYPVVDYAYSGVPTYPSGQIGYILGSKAKAGITRTALRTAKRAVPADMAKALRYYTADVHAAAFVLPPLVAAALIRTP